MNGEMFERYNEPARRSLFFSRYEASMLGSPVIGTEHLLLGVLKEREPLITDLLATANVTADALRQIIYARARASAAPLDVSVEIPINKDAKEVLQYAAQEADRLLHRHIGPEHLRLGVLGLEGGLAWEILREHGLSLTSIREALVIHVSANSPPPPDIAGMLAGLIPGSAARARKSGPIYSMSALDGPSPGRRSASSDAGGGFFSLSTAAFSTFADRPPDGRIHSIGPISAAGITLSQFALMLEEFLRAAVIIEDGALGGLFDIERQGIYDNEDALIAAVRDQLGLALDKSL
jgi:Clp amino terminal domain, pathogenicity island component